MENELVKRTECYIMQPYCYEITCDKCGGKNITWSEWDRLIWCYDCEIDTRGNGGIFDGPVPIGVCEILGISFDKLDIASGKRLYMRLDEENGKVLWEFKD